MSRPRKPPHCKCGWAAINYSKKYDAYYCPLCGEWVEKRCIDKECEYCSNRPEKPLESWYIYTKEEV